MAGRGDGMEAFRRYWVLLSKVPRQPYSIDTVRLGELLEAEGFSVSQRTVQRDLEKLQGYFHGLLCDETSRPYQWKWETNAQSFFLPKMSVEGAVTLELIAQHLKDILPRSSMKALRSVFDQARVTLQSHESARMARWPQKVRSLPRGYPRRPPEPRSPILEAVYQALLEERVLEVKYTKQGAALPADYTIHPLGLVERSGSLMLVCTIGDLDHPVSLLLHRMQRAVVLPSRRKRPKGFDLDAYIEAGGTGFQMGSQIKLKARVRDGFAQSLVESMLGPDQDLKPEEPGWEKLTVTVTDSMELRGFILSLGPLIEVLGPKKLREEIAREVRATAKQYGKG